jgi:hypothetical protein
MSTARTTPAARASWPAYAAKTLLALAVAVVGAAATITAALADGHVSAQEAWAIILAILLGLGGTGAVYRVPNDYTGRRPVPEGTTPTSAGGVGVPTTAVQPGAPVAYRRGSGYPTIEPLGDDDEPGRPGL